MMPSLTSPQTTDRLLYSHSQDPSTVLKGIQVPKLDSPLHHSNAYVWIGMMTRALLVHILTVNMTTSATDALTIQELPIIVTRQCFVLIKEKGLKGNPLLARKGGSCELRLTIIDSKPIDRFCCNHLPLHLLIVFCCNYHLPLLPII